MKIIHTSDIHIASPLTTRLSASKARERSREILATFRAMTEVARDEGFDAFIISGDLFDNERVGVRMLDTVM